MPFVLLDPDTATQINADPDPKPCLLLVTLKVLCVSLAAINVSLLLLTLPFFAVVPVAGSVS